MSIDSEQLAHLFLKGNHQDALSFIQQYPEQNITTVFSKLITPAMYHIGQLWESNEISVADEHLATGVCDFVLSRLYYITPDKTPSENKAMFLCLQGEEHYLGIKMISNIFSEKGWNCINFGSNLPLEYALKSALQHKPQVIGLSVSIVYNLPILKKYVETLASLPFKPTVLIGGRLAGRYDLEPYADKGVIIKDIEQAQEWLENKTERLKAQ